MAFAQVALDAHRLSLDCLEAINDFRKKYNIGIVLLAVPGFDRKIRLFDSVGCDVSLYHEYDAPRSDELRQILELRWRKETVNIEDSAITIIEEVTHSNIQKALNIRRECKYRARCTYVAKTCRIYRAK